MKKTISLILILTLLFTLAPFAVAEAKVEEELSLGVAEDNTYWNKSLSVGCTLGEDWYILNQEELLEINGYTQDMMEEALDNYVRTSDVFMDMYAVNMENGATINISVEKLSVVNAMILSEEKYVELSQKTLIDSLEQMGMTDIEFATDTIELDGETHCCIRLSGQYNGVTLNETMAVVKNKGNIVLITVACANEDISDVLGCFFREMK